MYKELIEKRKEEHNVKEWAPAKKNKSGKKFWNLINKQRRKRKLISENI